ncbi:MAG: sortase [Acidimicrobiales bacterium]
MRAITPIGPINRTLRESGLAFITLGLVIILFVAYQLLGTNFTEEANQSALRSEFDKALASGESGNTTQPTTPGATTTTTQAGTVIPNYAIDHLVIPKINLSKYIVQGVDETDLMEGPGHYPQTVMPGQVGNAGIAGHRTTFGAPFFDLNELAVGDMIDITNLTGDTFYYKVAKAPFVVDPSDVSVLDATTTAQLTLTTCNPRYLATNRLIVVADLTSAPAPTPTTTVPTATTPTTIASPGLAGGTTSAWPDALFWGALVILVYGGTRVLTLQTRDLRRLGSLAGGVALSIAPMWFLFENVVRLLPASY